MTGISRSRTERASRVERAQMLLAYPENPSFFAVSRIQAEPHFAAPPHPAAAPHFSAAPHLTAPPHAAAAAPHFAAARVAAHVAVRPALTRGNVGRSHTWGNSGLEAILKLWESAFQESTRPTHGPCNHRGPQWNSTLDWTYR